MVADKPTADEIKAQTLEWLSGTRFAADSIEPLTGGTANFIYRAQLRQPLDDGATEVVVKHGEGFVANTPTLEISTNRCAVEEKCLKAFEAIRGDASPPSQDSKVNFDVRTPKCYYYDDKTNTQIQESLPTALDLKTYVTRHFSAGTSTSQKAHCYRLGQSLARYITSFHLTTEKQVGEWLAKGGGEDAKPPMYAELAGHNDMQALKHMINYDWLLQRVDMFPDNLGDAKPIFEKVKQAAKDELESELLPIHGDFWTGNILLPGSELKEGEDIPVFVIDWEMAQLGVRSLDHGQMLAEMYMLWLYKGIEAGLSLLEGYVNGLGAIDEASAWRTAMQMGCHLLSFGVVTPGWGTDEQTREVAKIGRGFIVNAWNRNTVWFSQSDLACLFVQVMTES